MPLRSLVATCRTVAPISRAIFPTSPDSSTPLIELYLMYNEVAQILSAHGITVARNLVGPYITSLDMAGCSVTLLRASDELLHLWDAPVRTPALRWGI